MKTTFLIAIIATTLISLASCKKDTAQITGDELSQTDIQANQGMRMELDAMADYDDSLSSTSDVAMQAHHDSLYHMHHDIFIHHDSQYNHHHANDHHHVNYHHQLDSLHNHHHSHFPH